MNAFQIIRQIRNQSENVILFHSGTGKDSIALCDMLTKEFNKVTAVFMYFVPGLEYEQKYIQWATKNYSNIEFHQTPHFATYSFVKHGYLGIKKDASTPNRNLKYVIKSVKGLYHIDFAAFGFKKQDSVDRRIMLNSLDNGTATTGNFYPLMDWTNKNVLTYIKDNRLPEPFNYSKTKPSSGCDVSQPEFLSYLKQKHPNDLKKVFELYPYCEAILFRHENKAK